MNGLSIRPAAPDDRADLLELWMQTFPLKFAHLMGDATRPILKDWFERVPRVLANTHIAHDEDCHAVGYIQLATHRSTRLTEGLVPLFSATKRCLGLPRAVLCLARLALGELDTPKSNELLVKMLGVHRECRGRGVGTRLLEFAEQYARERDLRRIMLGVIVENDNAIRVYERFGFVRTTTHRFLVRWSINSEGYHVMVKELGRREPVPNKGLLSI